MYVVAWRGGGGGGGVGALQSVRLIMTYRGSLRLRGVPLSGLSHTKGKGNLSFHSLQ